MERRLMMDYITIVDEISGSLNAANHAAAMTLACYPEQIRGYGHVREASVARVEQDRSALVDAYRAAGRLTLDAAE